MAIFDTDRSICKIKEHMLETLADTDNQKRKIVSEDNSWTSKRNQ